MSGFVLSEKPQNDDIKCRRNLWCPLADFLPAGEIYLHQQTTQRRFTSRGRPEHTTA